MSQPRFELGLTCAGAVSAGAYTAGAIGFMFEALNEFYRLKKEGSIDAIPHEIKIKAMSGASAGGMCTALTAVSICDGNIDKFRESWVDMIDLKKLLDPSDLKANSGELKSLLNSSILDKIAAHAINVTKDSTQWAPYVDDYIDLFLTVTNINGVTYEVSMENSRGGYLVKTHADHVHFRLIKPGTSLPEHPQAGIYYLDATNPKCLDNWTFLQLCAKATGAFPIALENRKMKRMTEEYNLRKISCLQKDLNISSIKPRFLTEKEYDFLYVDGGMTNNEPFMLAHDVLAANQVGQKNPREGTLATRAVLMLDPFPEFNKDYEFEAKDQDALKLIGKLVGTLRTQSKFKLDELLTAMDESIYSRFLLAPTRSKFPDGVNMDEVSHVAGGGLDAFGGFIDVSFRQHDFDLGRRNCQQFLRKHLALPEKNPLFDQWTQAQRNTYYVINGDGGFDTDPQTGQKLLPIIPLVSEVVRKKIEEPEWPKTTAENLAAIESFLGERVSLLLDRFMDPLLDKWILRTASSLLGIKRKLSNKAKNMAMNKIRTELKAMGLL